MTHKNYKKTIPRAFSGTTTQGYQHATPANTAFIANSAARCQHRVIPSPITPSPLVPEAQLSPFSPDLTLLLLGFK